jgi:F-type H+-transporting ATPase subunit b
MDRKMWKMLTALFLVVLFCGVAGASGGTEHHADSGVLLKDFLWRCLNFAVTVGILAYFVTKPIRKGLAGRSAGIAEALESAEKIKREAAAKFSEYDRKLTKASEEIDAIYQEIRREGELERERIVANAKQMAIKIQQDAENLAELEVSKARTALRQEAARMAIEIAKELLEKEFTIKDQSRLVDEYMQKVGELH